MKITTDREGNIVLREVYSGILLETDHDEFMGICMRDTGFEFNYNDQWYSAQKGEISKMGVYQQITNPNEVLVTQYDSNDIPR